MSLLTRRADLSTKQLPLVVVTGATGYVGGRLVPMLLERGYRVRCIARDTRKLQDRVWRDHENVEVVSGDVGDTKMLPILLRDAEVAYYLVHSMIAKGASYVEQDRRLAKSFAESASAAGVQRIIYLGGLGELGEGLSEHLASRREVERMLASSEVPVTTLRAAMIIGSGSASFEILRYLVERLPAMITPRWVAVECQPIAIIDVLHYLIRCLEVPATAGKAIGIGGPDVVSYAELMQVAAKELGLRARWILPIPLLTPRLSSGWIALVTPVPYRIARPLAEGLRNRVVVTDDLAEQLMPHDALTVRESIHRAVTVTNQDTIPTRWSAAGPMPGDPDWAGGKTFVDERSIVIDADPMTVFKAVCRVGGGHGWYAGDILWRLRGWMDQLVGGPGLRRGRRHTEDIEFGEALDFWRVVGIERGKSLLLHAEMKLPGVARLEFHLDPTDKAQSEAAEPEATPQQTKLTMAARFRPKGLFGLAYWYAVVPLHALVFGGMLNGIKRAAEKPETVPAAS